MLWGTVAACFVGEESSQVSLICAAACRAQPSESIDCGCLELVRQGDERLDARCKRLDQYHARMV